MRRAVLAIAMALAACGQQDEEALVTGEEAAPGEIPLPPQPVGPTPEQLAQLDSRDCRTVAQAYFDALERRAFDFAALFWDDPVIDGARLEALLHGYRAPSFEIASVQEEGAAGSLYCTVTGALGEGGDPDRALRPGKIVLRRANDVPGATPEQLRWTIQSNTFVELMERSGKGEPG